jgi:hypothetical protein
MLALVASVALPARAATQPPPPGMEPALDAARAIRGETLEISVLTFANGEVLWERFGHNALVVTDTITGRSLAYNWGVFDFDQPNFLARFLTGETRYWLAAYPTRAMFEAYVADDRTARRQVLALSNVEKAALAEFVGWQSQEENRYYRYDYYLDNCSTRVRDAIDRALGGLLARTLADVPASPRTWRGETARVTDGDWPPYAGIHVALGRNADQPLTRWHESFMPGLLADHLATVMVTGADGVSRPLVAHDTILYSAMRAPLADRAPARWSIAIIIGALLAALVVVLGQKRDSSRVARFTVHGIATLWYLVGGLLGTALLLAATVTKHAPYMGSNGSLFQVHPLLLVGAVCALLASRPGASRLLSRLSVLFAGLSVLGLALQVVAFGQQSWVVVAVTVPVHVALALALRAHGGSAPAASPRLAQARAA